MQGLRHGAAGSFTALAPRGHLQFLSVQIISLTMYQLHSVSQLPTRGGITHTAALFTAPTWNGLPSVF